MLQTTRAWFNKSSSDSKPANDVVAFNKMIIDGEEVQTAVQRAEKLCGKVMGGSINCRKCGANKRPVM